MKLRLSEEFMLAALDETKGTFAPFKPSLKAYTLAGALLHDLFAAQKLELDGDGETVKIVDDTATGDVLLDKALALMTEVPKPKKVQFWVTKFSGKFKDFSRQLINDMIEKGLLRRLGEDDPGMGGTKSKDRFRIWFDQPFMELKKEVGDVLVYGKSPDPGNLKLIGLIAACKLVDNVLKDKSKEERAQAKIRAGQLAEDDVIRKAIKNAVGAMRASIGSAFISGIVILLKELC
jgi:hypothetical protein